MESVLDWSGLQPELLSQIASGLSIMEDFAAFRGVCSSWRVAAAKEDRFVTVCKVPLLMLSQNKSRCAEREFYSLSKRKICMRTTFPGAMGKRCLDVGFGWILTTASSGDVSLVKPFSSERIQLPNYTTFPDYCKSNPPFSYIDEAWLTANPSKTSNFKLLVSVNLSTGFWRNGDKNWTEMKFNRNCFGGMVYCNGKLYVLDSGDQILIFDPQSADLTKSLVVAPVKNVPTSFNAWSHRYLVTSTDGELLIIIRNNVSDDEYLATGADHFGVMRVDFVKGECKEINDLGKDAIFIGNNAAISVVATEFPGVLKPNCIYFTDNLTENHFFIDSWKKGGGKDMGIYNVQDGRIERFQVESYGKVCPPLWIFPSF